MEHFRGVDVRVYLETSFSCRMLVLRRREQTWDGQGNIIVGILLPSLCPFPKSNLVETPRSNPSLIPPFPKHQRRKRDTPGDRGQALGVSDLTANLIPKCPHCSAPPRSDYQTLRRPAVRSGPSVLTLLGVKMTCRAPCREERRRETAWLSLLARRHQREFSPPRTEKPPFPFFEVPELAA